MIREVRSSGVLSRDRRRLSRKFDTCIPCPHLTRVHGTAEVIVFFRVGQIQGCVDVT